MAKMTLLQMVQDIMSDMDSDAILSITDTVESEQVAQTIKTVYDQLVADQIIPELMVLGQLTTPNLVTYPGALNYLQVPTTYSSVDIIKYDCQTSGATSPNYLDMRYLEPEDFLNLVDLNQADQGNVVQVTDPGAAGVQYYVRNDYHPQWYTSFDDQYLAFESIDMAVDTVQLLGSKTRVTAKTIPAWTVLDTFVPQIDDNLFPYLLAEAKATCFVNLKQQQNMKVEKQSRDQRIRAQGNKFRAQANQADSTGNTGPNYGRS